MFNVQVLLDLFLTSLLIATLFHALRLNHALRALKQDRGALDALLTTFNSSTRNAEAGIMALRQLTGATADQMAQQAELGAAMKDELAFLIDRGDRVADRLDALVRTTRPLAAEPLQTPRHVHADPGERKASGLHAPLAEAPRVRSQAERDLLDALKAIR